MEVDVRSIKMKTLKMAFAALLIGVSFNVSAAGDDEYFYEDEFSLEAERIKEAEIKTEAESRAQDSSYSTENNTKSGSNEPSQNPRTTTDANRSDNNSRQADKKNMSDWYNFGDPTDLHSYIAMYAGNEGADISFGLGGYLFGSFTHQLVLEANNNLEYYNIDYNIVDTSTNTGFSINTTWDRDFIFARDSHDTSVSVIKKLSIIPEEFAIYPQLYLGELLGSYVHSTTYVKLDSAFRYSVQKRRLWLGITPSYQYAITGENIREFNLLLDMGLQFTDSFGLSAHWDNDYEKISAGIKFAF